MTTKDKMLDVAVRLFHTKGYDGTSVRDIAAGANVNVALVSYHFGGKKGLYEEVMTHFLEGYLHVMKGELHRDFSSEKDRLLSMLRALLIYQSSNHYVARIVHREMTLDSTLVRELMATYLRKEKHDFEKIIRLGMKKGEFRRQPIDYVVIHIRTMMITPYLSPHYLRELYQITPSDPYFVDRYMEHLERWIDLSLCKLQETAASVYTIPG
ncbi:forespore capture DNA-binding protein RefZ [bacterium LRH843]|nr:forespore capture DNA-binding protein RefZ [bacterium LRH843]